MAKSLLLSESSRSLPFETVRLEELPPLSIDLKSAHFGVDDFAFSLATGSMAVASSLALARPLQNLHRDAHRHHWFGHGDAPADKFRGKIHRLEFGHDLLNPQEVFSANAQKYGGNAIGLLAWLAHLAADALSQQGLPTPGLPTLKKHLAPTWSPDPKEYRYYMTLKARDLAGSALVEVLLAAYVHLHAKEAGTPWNGTRWQALRFFSHAFAGLGGLILPTSEQSLNLSSVMMATHALMKLGVIAHENESILRERSLTIERNDQTLLNFGLEIEKFLLDVGRGQDALDHRVLAQLETASRQNELEDQFLNKRVS